MITTAEIHIGYPKRQQSLFAEHRRHIVPFRAACSPAVRHFIKIVHKASISCFILLYSNVLCSKISHIPVRSMTMNSLFRRCIPYLCAGLISIPVFYCIFFRNKPMLIGISDSCFLCGILLVLFSLVCFLFILL